MREQHRGGIRRSGECPVAELGPGVADDQTVVVDVVGPRVVAGAEVAGPAVEIPARRTARALGVLAFADDDAGMVHGTRHARSEIGHPAPGATPERVVLALVVRGVPPHHDTPVVDVRRPRDGPYQLDRPP
jgi:hypothetical protein